MSGEGFMDDIETEEDSEEVEATRVESASETSIVEPAASSSEVSEMYEKFQEMKDVIVEDNDKTKIGNGWHINKSGWRKIATAFNVSVDVAERRTWTEEYDDGTQIVKSEVVARATAPNGKEVTAMGVCASNESNFTRVLGDYDSIESAGKDALEYTVADTIPPNAVIKMDGKWRMIKKPSEVDQHNILTIASTRAKNRAISDLVGGGEVSAEEISADDVL